MSKNCLLGITDIEGLRGCLGNALAEFAGDVGASLDLRTGSQKLLKQAKGIGFRCATHSPLTGYQCVRQTVSILDTQVTYTHRQIN